ncbi:MAG TPA: hypothetical protein VN761_07490 [Candidatus Polarisedimenticolia bacterium]|nr:hypothetical protein [Candidatus Polarisedimenticolia bacterium]
MSWDSFHERSKWGGRNASLFVVVVVLLCFGTGLVSAMGLYKYADEFLAILAVFIAVRLCIMTKKIRQKRADRLNAPFDSSDAAELSRDELRKARSKLTRNKNVSLPQRRY